MSLRSKIITAAFIGAAFVVGFFAHGLTSPSAEGVGSDNSNVDVRQAGSHGESLTNPLLECAELPESISIAERKGLENDIRNIITEYQSAGKIVEASVYFRDLNNGPWFGIEQEKDFYPGSLLKVPLAMSFYWHAEDDPDSLKKTFVYEKGAQDFDANQPFRHPTPLEDGKEYSVQELIEIMLRESSNEAALALAQLAGVDRVMSVYRDFGITPPQTGADTQLDVHTFASFFRILYNATYLDRTYSEEMLSVLARSTFREGIPSGVPSNIIVAHKFGTREIGGKAVTRQLHDCGIIYAGENPYVLCIMTQGSDYAQLTDFIKEISSLVYERISQ